MLEDKKNKLLYVSFQNKEEIKLLQYKDYLQKYKEESIDIQNELKRLNEKIRRGNFMHKI